MASVTSTERRLSAASSGSSLVKRTCSCSPQSPVKEAGSDRGVFGTSAIRKDEGEGLAGESIGVIPTTSPTALVMLVRSSLVCFILGIGELGAERQMRQSESGPVEKSTVRVSSSLLSLFVDPLFLITDKLW